MIFLSTFDFFYRDYFLYLFLRRGLSVPCEGVDLNAKDFPIRRGHVLSPSFLQLAWRQTQYVCFYLPWKSLAIQLLYSPGITLLWDLKVFKMKQKANNFKFRVLPLKPYPNWDQIGIPFMYVKKVGLLLKLPLPVKVLKHGIRLPVTEGEVLL